MVRKNIHICIEKKNLRSTEGNQGSIPFPQIRSGQHFNIVSTAEVQCHAHKEAVRKMLGRGVPTGQKNKERIRGFTYILTIKVQCHMPKQTSQRPVPDRAKSNLERQEGHLRPDDDRADPPVKIEV